MSRNRARKAPVWQKHGLRPAYLDLWDDQPEVTIASERGIRCVAFANVHHDPEKMGRDEEKIAKPNQRFFTDLRQARERLLSVG